MSPLRGPIKNCCMSNRSGILRRHSIKKWGCLAMLVCYLDLFAQSKQICIGSGITYLLKIKGNILEQEYTKHIHKSSRC